jgi:hypothetical protein
MTFSSFVPWILRSTGFVGNLAFYLGFCTTSSATPTRSQTWGTELSLLYEAGIDLIDYGRGEQELVRSGQTTSRCWLPIRRRAFLLTYQSLDYYEKQVGKDFSISFKYGSKPSDWQFWFIEQMNNSFAEFWDMVDHPERAMPGSWDEWSDDEY